MANKILISSCLLGNPVRYDGQSKDVKHSVVLRWLNQGRLIKICPEMAGGLGVPRDAAEIQAVNIDDNWRGTGEAVITGNARVVTRRGADVTSAFVNGAQAALALIQLYDVRWALLKSNSPSCGNRKIYSGQFDGSLTDGRGVTAELLHSHGVQVFNEKEISSLVEAMGEAN